MSAARLASLSDEQLTILVQATGDEGAFGLLVTRHQGALQAFLSRYTGNLHQAEDLTQNTFIRAYEHIASFRADASFRTWLFSIAYREFLQARRKAGAVRRMIDRLKLHDPPASASDSASSVDIQKGLGALDERERAALLLADACGMSHAEVAQTLGAPLGTVKSCISRARRKLGAALGDAYVR